MYFIFAFIAGLTSLVYEVIWMRYLGLVLGNTVQATALTVAVFIAGIGFGAFIFGSAADRSQNRLRLFSKIQFGAAISSFISLFILNNLPKLSSFFSAQGFYSNRLLAILIGSLFMLTSAIFFGGAFPVLAKCVIKEKSMIKSRLGLIYAINTLGCILGIFITAFMLIRLTGMIGTQLIAIFVNSLLGLIALMRSSTTEPSAWPGALLTKPPKEILSAEFVAIAFIIGFNSLGLEILWTRIINIYLANTTYGFATVLIIFLCGISLGSFVYGRFLSHRFNSLFLVAFAQIIIGIFILFSVLFVHKIPLILMIFKPIMDIPLIRLFLPGFIAITLLSFIPTLFMGISFPALIGHCTNEAYNLGEKIGIIFSANIGGNIIGSALTGFVIIGLLGVVRSLVLLALISFVISFYILLLVAKTRLKALKFCLNSFMIILCIILLISKIAPTSILPPSFYDKNKYNILHYNETSAGTVIVSEEIETKIKACHINNSAVIGTAFDALITVKMLGYLPCFYKPDSKSALIIGFGTGVTASILARHNIDTVDCVEICPGVRKAATFFSEFNDSITNNPRINFINGDGRIYILETQKKYDIISCDPTHPTLGSNNLYTREYFEYCKQKLKKNGVICQYLPLHKLSDNEFRCLIKTFAQVFPECAIWLAHSHGIMVGANGLLSIDFKQIEEDLAVYPDQYLDDPFFIGACFMNDSEKIRELTENADINSDNFPILEFFSPASLMADNWHANFTILLGSRTAADRIFTSIENIERYRRYWTGNHYFFASLIHKSRGELQAMIETLNYALSINPENKIITNFYISEMKRLRQKSSIDN